MNLGENFSDEQKAAYVERNLKPSSVIKLFCRTTHPPKEKRLVIVSLTPELIFLVINTDVPRFYQNKPYLKHQQIKLESGKENFIDHDSWLDCSKIFQEFDVDDVREILLNDISRILGNLSNDLILNVMDVVVESETLEQKYINAILSDIK